VDEKEQPGILIGQIYLERAQFSHRDDALNLPPNTAWQPNLKVGFQGGVASDENTGFVRITVQTKVEEQPLYNIDLTMIALLAVDAKHQNLALKDYVRGAAPAMLYPFVREAIAALTWRGRFGPVWLSPFNIAAVMAQGPAAEAAVPVLKAKQPKRLKARTRSN
jgi:preprotein translocase subunit SecB